MVSCGVACYGMIRYIMFRDLDGTGAFLFEIIEAIRSQLNQGQGK